MLQKLSRSLADPLRSLEPSRSRRCNENRDGNTLPDRTSYHLLLNSAVKVRKKMIDLVLAYAIDCA